MNFEISVETFVRLAGVTKRIPDKVDENEAILLKCVRLERKDGELFALASNRRIAAIYYLGKSDGLDGAAHVVTDPAFVNQCETEKPFNSIIAVTVIPELQMASLKTTLGYNYPGNGAIFPVKTPLSDWRTWLPPIITETKGAMAWNLDDMQSLNSASPSGEIAFPEFIDVGKPVVLRDIKTDNWVGLFMANRSDENGRMYAIEPAKLPTWCR